MRALLLLLLVGCVPEPGPGRRAPTEETGTPAGTPTGTGLPTTGLPTTGTVTTASYDCDAPLLQPPLDITRYGIRTQEDFDFSLGGYLVYQSGLAVVGTNKQAQETVLSAGAAGDPRGVHGLSDGRIVIMSPWDGQIKIADPATGGLETLVGNLNTPNGVEIGDNDRIYFTTYGEVGWIEVDGSDSQIIHSWAGGGFGAAPNGTALSADGQKLYVAVPENNNTNFVMFDRTGPDSWGPAQVLHSVNGYFSGIDIDLCGNLYTVEYGSGAVYRIPTTGAPEVIAQLDGSGWAYSAMRFGPGHSDWERNMLYVSSRSDAVFEIDVGLPGRPHPTTPAP